MPAVPVTFGDSSRNMIIGPSTHQLNGVFTRDMRLGGNRALTLQVNAINLLNTVQWATVDTNVNSPTFGQVTLARPMRTHDRHMQGSGSDMRRRFAALLGAFGLVSRR